MHVQPLKEVSREDVRDLAHAAVHNGVPLKVANTFPAFSANHAHFEHDYIERDRELAAVD